MSRKEDANPGELTSGVSLWALETLLLVLPSASNRRKLEEAGLLLILSLIMKATLGRMQGLAAMMGTQLTQNLLNVII